MKRIISVFCIAALVLSLLAACTGGDTTSDASDTASTDSSASTDASTDSTGDATEAEPDNAKLEAIVSAIEAVNEVPNARALDDFSLENEIGLTMDNVLAFKGDVTNDQADCALVLAVQAKSGMADAVKAELEAYKEAISSNLYAEFADKVAKAQDSRIVVSGDYVVMVIAGVDGPDYSEIDSAIESALA